MIIDSSVLIAILTQESDAEDYANAISLASRTRVGAPTYVETALVLDHRPDVPPGTLDEFLDHAVVDIEPFTVEQARAARKAHHRFGRGSGSQARLNLGDCFSYALAITEDEPLLFKGDDFTHTDVRNALMESDHH